MASNQPILDESRKEEILSALRKADTLVDAARMLHVSRDTLRRAVNRLGLHEEYQQCLMSTNALHNAEQKELTILRTLVKELTEKKDQAELLARISDKTAQRSNPPTWVRESNQKKGEVILNAMASDWHYGEEVFPEQVEGSNAFNLSIADMRIRNFYVNTVRLGKDYLSGVSAKAIVVPYCGDLFSGNLHEDLLESNEAPVTDCFVRLYDQIIAGTELLAQQFGKVYCPWVVGNHARLFQKIRYKGYVRNNFEYMLGRMLAHYFKGRANVQFDISPSVDLTYQVFRTTYNLTHGNQFKGGSGISGLLSPLMIGDHRKRKRQNSVNKPYNWLLMGHWHMRAVFMSIMVNGALKGYDEFAYTHNFEFQEPVQSFWVDDPVHGVTITAPIFVRHKDEKWSTQTKRNIVE